MLNILKKIKQSLETIFESVFKTTKKQSLEDIFKSVFKTTLFAFCNNEPNTLLYLTNGIKNQSQDQINNILKRLHKDNDDNRYKITDVIHQLNTQNNSAK